jgi:hypothetical protein
VKPTLAAWLRRTPQPVAVLVDSQRRVEVPSSPRKWAELEATLLALEPETVACLSADGTTLRAMTLESAATSAEASPVRSDLVLLSRLLADAHERGAASTREAYGTIFSENTKLIGMLAQRLTAMEVQWQRAMQAQGRMLVESAAVQAEAIVAQAEQSANAGEDALFAPLMQGLMAAPPAGKKKASA